MYYQQLLFIILILIGYGIYSSDYNQFRAKRKYLLYVCIILVLQSALRNLAIGADTFQYYMRFHKTGASSWKDIFSYFYSVYVDGEGKDPGYRLLAKAFYTLIPNYRCWLLFVAIIFFTAWGKLMDRYCYTVRDILLAVSVYFLLFYSFFSITGIRQTIAVALSIFCFMAYQDKRYARFVVLTFIAFTIHKSAIFIFLIPLLNKIKNIRMLFMFCSILLVFFALTRDYFVNMGRMMNNDDVDFSIRLPYLLMLFYTLLTLLFYRSLTADKSNYILRSVFVTYIPTYAWIPLLGWDSPFMREVLYFAIYSMPLMVYSMNKIGGKRNLYSVFFVVFALSYFYYNECDYYKFCWEDMQLNARYESVMNISDLQFK